MNVKFLLNFSVLLNLERTSENKRKTSLDIEGKIWSKRSCQESKQIFKGDLASPLRSTFRACDKHIGNQKKTDCII